MINGPAINAYSRSIGNAKHILSQFRQDLPLRSSDSRRQLCLGANDCGQLGIGKMGVKSQQMGNNSEFSQKRKNAADVEDPVAKAKRRLMEKHDELAWRTDVGPGSRKRGKAEKKKKKLKRTEDTSRRGKNSKSQSDKVVMVNHPTPVGGLIAGKKVFMVSCGDQHTAAIAADHKLYCWGRAMTGALGLYSRPESMPHEVRLKPAVWVPGLSDRPLSSDDESENEQNGDVKKKSTCRTVMSEPEGTCGGDVSMADQWLPMLVEMPLTEQGNDPGPPFQVSCGYAHTAVICGAGRLYTCGWGGKGGLACYAHCHPLGPHQGADQHMGQGIQISILTPRIALCQ